MSESPFPASEVRRLARELAELKSTVAGLAIAQGVAGAQFSSLDGGTWVVKDANGTVRQQIGAQGDGTYTTVDRNAPPPPAPADPVVQAVPGGLKVTYTGEFADGEARPKDVAVIEVHVDLNAGFVVADSTLDAALVGKGSVTFATDDYVPHTVRLVARNTSGVRGAPSAAVTITPARLRPGDIPPGGVGTVELDDGAVTPPKSGTGVTSNLVPDAGFNDAGWRVKRTATPWGFVDAASVGFTGADWAAYCSPTTDRAALMVTATKGVPVIPGESYFIAYDAARSSSGVGKCWLEVSFRDSSGAVVTAAEGVDPFLTEVRSIASLPTASFETRDGQVTIPPSAAAMHVVMVRDDDAGTSVGQLYVDRIEVRSVVTRASQGQRVETSPSGVLVFDSTGNTIGSISPTGDLSMLHGQFNDGLTYKGEEVGDLLDQRARGEVARLDAGAGDSPATTSSILWLQFEFNAQQGRAYKLRSSGLRARSGTAGVGASLRVRYTTNGNTATSTSPILLTATAGLDQPLYLASDVGGLADSGDKRVRMNLYVVSPDSTASSYFTPFDTALGYSVWVEDVGQRPDSSGGIVNGGATGGTGTGGSTAPTTTTKTFATTWNCTWSRCWADSGFRQNAPMYQGRYDGVNGQNYSAFGFDYSSVSSTLSGATIKKLEVYLYAEHWYYAAGGEVWLGTTGLKGPPGNNIYPADANTTRFHWHLNKPEGRWVDLGSVGVTIGNELKSGTTGAFVLDARHPNNNLNDYGRITGAGGGTGSTAPGLRVTYSKAVTS